LFLLSCEGRTGRKGRWLSREAGFSKFLLRFRDPANKKVDGVISKSNLKSLDGATMIFEGSFELSLELGIASTKCGFTGVSYKTTSLSYY
jgi:hypothetical protein